MNDYTNPKHRDSANSLINFLANNFDISRTEDDRHTMIFLHDMDRIPRSLITFLQTFKAFAGITVNSNVLVIEVQKGV